MQKIFLTISALTWILMLGVTDHYLPWVSWHSEMMASLCVIFAFLPILFSAKKTIAIPNECFVFILLFIVALIQSFWGRLIYDSDVIVFAMYVVLIVSAIVTAYAYTANAKDKGRPTELFSMVFVLSGLILSVQSIIRTLDLSLMSEWVVGIGAHRRPGGNLAQPNHMATMLNLSVVSLCYLRFRLRVREWIFFCALAVMVLGIVISESRTGLLSLNAIAFFIGFWNFSFNKKLKYKFVIFVSGVNVFFFLWPSLWDAIQVMDGAMPSSVNLSSSGRFDLWWQTIIAILERPLFGWGYHQFTLAHMDVIPTFDKVLIATYSHNAILDLACWFGLPVALIFIYFGVRWIVINLKNAPMLEAKFGMLFLVPFFIHALLEFPHVYLYFLVPVGLAIGSVAGCSAHSKVFWINKIYYCIFYILFLTVGSMLIFEYFVVEEDFRLARFASVRVGSDPEGYKRRDLLLLRSLSELVDVVRMDPKPNTPADLDVARRVSHTYPWRAVMVKYAMEAKMNGNIDEYSNQVILLEKYFGEGAVVDLKQKLLEKSKIFNF